MAVRASRPFPERGALRVARRGLSPEAERGGAARAALAALPGPPRPFWACPAAATEASGRPSSPE